jgi:molybdate transport system ATP-binding protein
VLRAELELSLRDLGLELELSVEAGRCLGLVGPSGAGKTSTLRALAGLIGARRGVIECGGERWLDTRRRVDLPAERRRCGYLFQDYALFEHMSVWRNVAYGVRGAGRRERRDAALGALARFGIDHLAEERPGTLSGGERQRVALARVFASAPRALLLDEPMAALDASNRSRATRELRSLMREADVPAVLVTHDFDEAASLADEVAVLEAGTVVQRGEPAGLAAAPASAFVADLVGSVVLTGRARPRPDGLTEIDLDGGGVALSVDAERVGGVAISIHPWEITLEPAEDGRRSSARNRLPAAVVSVVAIGNRVRVGLDAVQPLVAEVTPEAVDHLRLRPGTRVLATWKASATRLVER